MSERKAVAYTTSRFPKITETFVLYELLEVEKEGLTVEIYPLIDHHDSVEHPEALRMRKKAHYLPFISFDILKSNFSSFCSQPLNYLKTLGELLLSAFPNPKFMAGTLAIWPKSVHFAHDMQEREVGHIHAHFATHGATSALIVHRLTGIPFSFTAHAHDIFMDLEMLDLKLADAKFVVVISEFNRRWLCKHFGQEIDAKLHTIHCGVNPTIFHTRPAERSPGPLRLLSVASFKDMKGHTYLLKAMRTLLDGLAHDGKKTDLRLDLVGDGPLRKQIEEEIKALDLGNHVFINGSLLRNQVSEMTRNADLAVMASVWGARGDMEGIPVSLMEAMCVGLPVISTGISGIPELIEDRVNGYLVPPEQPEPLATALRAIIDKDDLGRSMGQAGREKVLQEFNLRDNARKLAVLFRKSLKDNQ
ncbi:glycosyltransferase family 4 protein [Maridesulfovibrio sp.]|uniref:glycosyltransferase family 4 protein n=1 Tax=Maridesulfovibrio sp. TaxID=2795000 RepID=UPI003BAA356D